MSVLREPTYELPLPRDPEVASANGTKPTAAPVAQKAAPVAQKAAPVTQKSAVPLPNSQSQPPQLLFMMKTTNAASCSAVGGQHFGGRSCKVPCVSGDNVFARAPVSHAAARALQWHEVDGSGGLFAGNQSAASRIQQLQRCGDAPLRCGFEAPSVRTRFCSRRSHMTPVMSGLRSRLHAQAFDAARSVARAAAASCRIVVLTAVFDQTDALHPPRHDPQTRGCLFAFVDVASAQMLLRRPAAQPLSSAAEGAAAEALPTVGPWRLIVLRGEMPSPSARRNSRVPKLLPHRLFPDASFAVWVEAKLEHLFLDSCRVVLMPADSFWPLVHRWTRSSSSRSPPRTPSSASSSHPRPASPLASPASPPRLPPRIPRLSVTPPWVSVTPPWGLHAHADCTARPQASPRCATCAATRSPRSTPGSAAGDARTRRVPSGTRRASL